MTKKEFRYFKDNWNAHCWLTKPIFTLPLTKIAKIERYGNDYCRVKVRVPKDNKSKNSKMQPTFSSIITKNEAIRGKVDEQNEFQF